MEAFDKLLNQEFWFQTFDFKHLMNLLSGTWIAVFVQRRVWTSRIGIQDSQSNECQSEHQRIPSVRSECLLNRVRWADHWIRQSNGIPPISTDTLNQNVWVKKSFIERHPNGEINRTLSDRLHLASNRVNYWLYWLLSSRVWLPPAVALFHCVC